MNLQSMIKKMITTKPKDSSTCTNNSFNTKKIRAIIIIRTGYNKCNGCGLKDRVCMYRYLTSNNSIP